MKNYLERIPFIYSFINSENFSNLPEPLDLASPDRAFMDKVDLPISAVSHIRDTLDLSSRSSDISDVDSADLSSGSSEISYGDSVELSSTPDMAYRAPCLIIDSEPDVLRGTQEIDLETKLPIYTLNEVSYHDMYDDCWIILYDRVYDITRFLQEHPGGEDVLMENAGRDATISFRSVGHSRGALNALEEYLIGILPDSQRMFPIDSESRWSIL